MLNDIQKQALRLWYARAEVKAEAKRLIELEQWEDLEEYVHMFALMPLKRHSELPDYLKNEAGEPLIPSNANPMASEDDWQDAIEVGWSVMEAELGVSQGHVNKAIKQNEDSAWESFIKRADRRKKELEKG